MEGTDSQFDPSLSEPVALATERFLPPEIEEEFGWAFYTPMDRVLHNIPRPEPLTAADVDLRGGGRLVPYLAAAQDAYDAKGLWDAARAVEEDRATPEEWRTFAGFLAHTQTPKTVGYRAASILADMPAFMGEFVGGGLIARGLSKGATAAARKLAGEAVREAVERSGKRGAMGAVLKRAGQVGGAAAAQTATSELLPRLAGEEGRISASTYQRALPEVSMEQGEAGRLMVAFNESTEDFLDALPRGIADQLIENTTEHLGALIPGAQSAIMRRWLKAGEKFEKRTPDGFSEALDRLGWNGLLGELAEERLGGALRATGAGVGLEEAEDPWAAIIPEAQDFAAEVIAIGGVGLAAAGAGKAASKVAEGKVTGPGADPQVTGEREVPVGPDSSEKPAELAQTAQGKELAAEAKVAPDSAPEPKPDGDGSVEAGSLGEIPEKSVPEEPSRGGAPVRARSGDPSPEGFARPEELPATVAEPAAEDPITGQVTLTDLAPIGDSLKGNLKAPEAPLPGKPVNRPQVIDSLAKVVEAAGGTAPIKVGAKGKPRNVLGFFKVRPEVVRVRTANDIATAAHEVAHALDKQVFGSLNGIAGAAPSATHGELAKLDYDPSQGRLFEGWAEFVRHWVTNTGELPQRAPKTLAWFNETFLPGNPAVAAALEDARALSERWQLQGSIERGKQTLVRESGVGARARRAIEDARALASKEATIEALAPLEAYRDFANEKLGQELPVTADPFVTADSFRLAHSGIARVMVEDTMVDLAGNSIGPALSEIRPLVQGKREDFALYLYALRAEALLEDPKGSRNPGISLPDAKQILRELYTPEFDLAAHKVHQWYAGVQNYAASASPTFAASLKKIRERDPGRYVPLYREFEVYARALSSTQAPGAASGSLSKRLKGSGRRVKDPLESLVSSAEDLVRRAHQRMVIDQVLAIGQGVPGMGLYVEEVPRDKVPIAQNVAAVIEAIENQTGAKVKVETPVEDLESDTVVFFTDAYQPKAGEDPIVPVVQEGKVKWFRLDHGLHRAIGGMRLEPMNKWLDLVFGTPKRAFTVGTTGLRAGFSLITNPMRDGVTLWHNTRSFSLGPRLFFDYMQRLFNAGVRAATDGKKGKDPYLDAFDRLGVGMAQPLNYDSPRTARATDRLFQGKFRVLQPGNALDYIREVFQFPESAARAAELKNVGKDIGWKAGKPMTLEQSIKLRLAAKRVTTDFSASGSSGLVRALSQSVPFFTAATQGLRTFVRTKKERPAQFWFRGLQIAASTLAMWWLLKDEEWYADMEDDERFLYWHVPAGDEVLRIPRPQEIGGVFAALPEMFADAWYREDPETAKAWFSEMFDVARPPLVPVLPGEVIEQAANRDFFWDRPIVDRSLQQKPEGEQFNEYTSRAARALGNVFDVSPQRIDHAIRGVFGGLGADIIDVLGLGNEKQRKDPELADAPVLGRLFLRGGTTGYRSKAVDRLYDELGEMRKLQASDVQIETEDQRQLRLLVQDATQALSALSRVRSEVAGDDRAAITREMRLIAKDALGRVEQGGRVSQSARNRFTNAEKAAKRREEQTRR